MNQYEHALIAMQRLLDSVGISDWSKWIETDIEEWRRHRDVSHHLSAYGGMGSFNDIWICEENRNRISKTQEPWANSLFRWLKALCFFLAHHPNETFEAVNLSKQIGRDDSDLSAFVGGDRAPKSMRVYANQNPIILGDRCFNCGYAEVSDLSIEGMITDEVIPSMLFTACEHGALDKLVDRVLAIDIPDLDSKRRYLLDAIKRSDIVHRNREGWMRPCPNCGDNDTGTYRWRLIIDNELRFEPSDDNLPLRD